MYWRHPVCPHLLCLFTFFVFVLGRCADAMREAGVYDALAVPDPGTKRQRGGDGEQQNDGGEQQQQEEQRGEGQETRQEAEPQQQRLVPARLEAWELLSSSNIRSLSNAAESAATDGTGEPVHTPGSQAAAQASDDSSPSAEHARPQGDPPASALERISSSSATSEGALEDGGALKRKQPDSVDALG
jgi:hypothetical protein